jgi:hypothetical protein
MRIEEEGFCSLQVQKICLKKPPDTVGELKNTEVCVSHHAFCEGKKAWETYARKSGPGTLK